MHGTKISLEFEWQGQRAKAKVTGDKKKTKNAESSPLTMHGKATHALENSPLYGRRGMTG